MMREHIQFAVAASAIRRQSFMPDIETALQRAFAKQGLKP
jgi:hypothetical protein